MLTAILAALLNLSTLVANQPKIAKRGIMVLLKTNSSLFQVVSNKVGHAGAVNGHAGVCLLHMHGRLSHLYLPQVTVTVTGQRRVVLPQLAARFPEKPPRHILTKHCKSPAGYLPTIS